MHLRQDAYPVTGHHSAKLTSPRHVPTYYSARGTGSTIDLIWSNFLASQLVGQSTVLLENHGLDHQAIELELNLLRPTTLTRQTRPNWGVVSPDLACQRLNKTTELLRLNPPSSTDEWVQRLTSGLSQVQDSFGKTVSDNPHRAKSWWCKKTLDPIVKTRNQARQWFILTKSAESADCYRQWNLYFRDVVKTLKWTKWLCFLERLDEDTLWKALRVTKAAKKNTIPPLWRPDGTLTSNKIEQAELLFKGTSCIPAPVDLADVPVRPLSRFVCYPQVSIEEVADCIKKIPPKRAPGIDGIANQLLKISSPSLAPTLTTIFNQSFSASSFPSPWKCAVTAIIPKSGKDDYTDPNVYRPIALLSGLGKIFELVITRQLTSWAERHNILADGHLGGRKGAGTEDALVLLDTWVRQKWNEKKYVAGLFLDVKSAYPSVHPRRLIQYLASLKCPAYLIGIVESFLENRSTTIRMDDFTSCPFNIDIGLPQGSPPLVILYILYNNSLLTKECSLASDSISIGYIDDVVHLAAAKSNHATLESLTNLGAHSLGWGSRFGAIFDKKESTVFVAHPESSLP
ncbi:hypothetical protein PCASD_08397 [Puccinia coronata f. sp. avenae]|uniref:Reverse transcriptase domain-containing protein n=1 Tax=Puccinia coronata f. sp. avenae TaxID=200324 RepID=A0A2N5TFX4_9BASI|nr:hypothetical protein PCASD_08397 [Puccinia coronata f. sp. avenae]